MKKTIFFGVLLTLILTETVIPNFLQLNTSQNLIGTMVPNILQKNIPQKVIGPMIPPNFLQTNISQNLKKLEIANTVFITEIPPILANLLNIGIKSD
jgi:hypothetical protein